MAGTNERSFMSQSYGTLCGEFAKKMLPKTGTQYPVPIFVANQNWFSDPSLPLIYLGKAQSLTNDVLTFQVVPRYYFRNIIPRLWTYLDNRITTSVVGPPGAGKSIACLQYALSRNDDNTNTNRFLYLRGIGSFLVMIFFRMKSNQYEVVRLPSQPENLVKWLEHLLENSQSARNILQVKTVIIDGFNDTLQEQFHSLMIPYQQIKFIRVISWQSQRVSANAMTVRPVNTFVFPGWKKEEYWAAHQEQCFSYFPVALTMELLDERFFYAGRNARFFSTGGTQWAEYIVEAVNTAIDGVYNLESMSLRTVGTSSSVAVNTLFSKSDIDNTVNAPVSQFIARMVARRTEQAFVDSARSYLPNNPAFQAWITELEIMARMKTPTFQLYSFQNRAAVGQAVRVPATAAYVLAHQNGENEIEAAVRRVAAAQQIVAGHAVMAPEIWNSMAPPCWFFDAADLNSKNLVGNHYYFPMKWNHECFDGIFLPDRHTAYFFKVTISEKHSFNPLHLVDYVIALGVHRVEMVYICPKHICALFKLPIFKQIGDVDTWGNSNAATTRRTKFRILHFFLGLIAQRNEQIPFFNVRVASYEQ